MEDIRDIMETAEQLSTLVADAILKRTFPMSDDIPEREAKRAYGARWISKAKASGLAEAHRIGGRVIYSRHQLDCLRAAERRKAQLRFRDKSCEDHQEKMGASND